MAKLHPPQVVLWPVLYSELGHELVLTKRVQRIYGGRVELAN